jgi:hypothetical protein
MLKQFNLLVEEVSSEVKMDFRFSASKYLNHNLSFSEKQSLNKKYNKIVETSLKAIAGTDEAERLFYLSEDNHWVKQNVKIIKVEGGIVFWKSLKGEENKTPVDAIVNSAVMNEMYKDENNLKEKIKNGKEAALKEVTSNVSPELQYLIEQKYISGLDIVNSLSFSSENKHYVITVNSKKIFEDDKALEIFEIDPDSKEFENAKKDSSSSSEAWYYLGGNELTLKIILNILEGERFDLSRISNVEFQHEYKAVAGAGTKGEF